jgi:high affinity sulfate transporter 1
LRLPLLTWRRGYRRAWLSQDLLGGLSAGAVVIPQAMAYATIADLPVEVGLYTCMVPMAAYAVLGGSRTLSVSTTSTVAVLTGSTLLAAGIAAEGTDPARDLATLTVLVGLVLLLARVLRIGSVIDNISEATLTGIKFGVGLTVAAGQLPKLLGIPGDPTASGFFEEVDAVLDQLADVSVVTLVFSVATIALFLVLARVAPKIPGPLVAVVLGIVLVAFAGLDEHGLAIVGEVPSGLPTPVAPSFDRVDELLPGAFAIAIMVFLETVAVARQVRRPEEPAIDNDQELLASGVSCVAGAVFRAMPSAGGFSQTAINQRAGARTQASELVTVVLAVGCALLLGGVLEDLPSATLGAMVVVAVLGLIKPSELRRFWRLSRIEFWVLVVTAASGLVFGLLVAVLVGVLLTFLIVLVELDRIGLTELQPTPSGDDVLVAGPDTEAVRGLLVLRFDGPLYTGNIRSVNRKALAAVDARGDVEVLVMDATSVGYLPVTVMDEVGEFEAALAERGAQLWVAALMPDVLTAAQQTARWDEVVGAGRVHATALAAVRAFRG